MPPTRDPPRLPPAPPSLPRPSPLVPALHTFPDGSPTPSPKTTSLPQPPGKGQQRTSPQGCFWAPMEPCQGHRRPLPPLHRQRPSRSRTHPLSKVRASALQADHPCLSQAEAEGLQQGAAPPHPLQVCQSSQTNRGGDPRHIRPPPCPSPQQGEVMEVSGISL